MTHAEKERLVLSGVLALVLYATLFFITGWLNILHIEDTPFYAGPLFVELSLDPSSDPNLAESDDAVEETDELATETAETDAESVAEPDSAPEPNPELTTQPEPKLEVEPVSEPVQETPPEPEPEPIPEPVPEPTPDPVAEPSAVSASEPTREPATETVAAQPQVQDTSTESSPSTQAEAATPSRTEPVTPKTDPTPTPSNTTDPASSETPSSETATTLDAESEPVVEQSDGTPLAEPSRADTVEDPGAPGDELFNPDIDDSAETKESTDNTSLSSTEIAEQEKFTDAPLSEHNEVQRDGEDDYQYPERKATDTKEEDDMPRLRIPGDDVGIATRTIPGSSMATSNPDTVRNTNTQPTETGPIYPDEEPDTSSNTGSSQQANAQSSSTQPENITDDGSESSDLGRLDNILKNVTNSDGESGNGEVSAGNSVGDGSETTTSTGIPGNSVIEARNLQELSNQRQILRQIEPDLAELIKANPNLFEGKRRIDVRMSFDISPQGFVVNPGWVQSSGSPAADTKILEALRQWKFVPLNQDQVQSNQTAILSWEIHATSD